MPNANAHNASPAPSRALRPRHITQVSNGRSNTGTFSQTALSPVGSAEDNHTPEGTYRGSSPMSSPTVDVSPGCDASHIAVRGSVPPSPILKARQLKTKETSYLQAQTPSPGGWSPADETSAPAEDGDRLLAKSGSIDEVTESESEIEEKAHSSIPVPRTANNGRVIAVDLDLVLPRPSSEGAGGDDTTGANGETEPIIGAPVQVIDEPDAILSPTQMKGATSGMLLALKQLRALGHPLHLIAARPACDRSEIEFWLAGQGISTGTDEDDTVAALWLTDFSLTSPTEASPAGVGRGRGVFWPGTRGQEAKRGDPKLQVLRAMNAALFITTSGSLSPALTSAALDIAVIALDLKTSFSGTKSSENKATSGINVADEGKTPAGHETVLRQNRWGEVVAWVKAWDSK